MTCSPIISQHAAGAAVVLVRYRDRAGGDVTKGHAATLDEAKAKFRENWMTAIEAR
jgi:hypothetical protein